MIGTFVDGKLIATINTNIIKSSDSKVVTVYYGNIKIRIEVHDKKMEVFTGSEKPVIILEETT